MASIKDLTLQLKELTVVIENAKKELAELEKFVQNPAAVNTAGFEQAIARIKELNSLIAQTQKERHGIVVNVDKSSTAQIESVDKALTTLKTKLQSQQALKTNLLNTAQDEAELDNLNEQIKRTEIAIKSFTTQRTNLGNISYPAVSTNIPGGAGAGGTNMPAAVPTALGERGANIAAIALQDVKTGTTRNQMEEDVTSKIWNQYQRELENATMRIRFEGDVHYDAARKWAEANGFAIEDLKRIQTYAGGKQQVATFENVNPATGVTNQGRVGINEQGQVTQSYIPRQNQTFGQGIFRDFAELTKWSVAITLLYAPLNALNTSMQKMIENQAKLAQVSIAVNSAIADQSQIFGTASNIAQQMGEDVGGVIDAFDQAYRAAGATSTGIEKYQTATKLLTDAITLSKISTLDQAQSIDYLSAALLQTNRPLTDGVHLLDEWVLVSKNANVTVGDLAQAVATIGGSAETAGLSIEQLNSVVAALSQATPLTGASLTNAVKALIGQYQTPEATKALGNYGIAVKDISGKTREFLDVMSDVSKLRTTGVLGEQDFNTLTLALGGGGIRNQKNVQAFINNFGRIQELTKLQTGTNAQGQAAEALSKKLDTVETAATRLGNAFQELGQALGVKGGLLDDFALIINLATKLVEIITKLADVLGKTGPLLAGIGIAGLIGKYGGGLGIGGMFGMGGALGQMSDEEKLAGGAPGRNLKRLGLSIGAFALPALGNAYQKDYAAAGADVVGGIGGALIGGPIGAALGAAIAESFVHGVLQSKDTLADAFKPAIKTATEGLGQGGAVGQKQPTTADIFQGVGATLRMGGSIKTVPPWLQELVGTAFSNIVVTGEQLPFGIGKSVFGGAPGQRPATASAFGLEYLKQYNPQLYEQFKPYVPVQTQAQVIQNQPQTNALLMSLQATKTEQLRQQVTTGQISPADYANQLQSLGGYTVTATQYMVAFGEQFKKLRPEIKSDADEYKKFLDIIVYGSDEQKNTINSLIAGLEGLSGKQLEAQKGAIADYVNKVFQQTTVAQINLPQIVGPSIQGQGRTTAEVNLITQLAKQMQEQFYTSAGGGNLNQDEINALEESFKAFSVYVEEAGKSFYTSVEKTDQKFYTDAEKALENLGKISTQQQGFGIQAFDVNRATLEALAAKSVMLGQQWAQQYPGFQTNPEEVLASTKDGITKPITADLKILAILLQALNDKAQKQLDGMYNIPEGATFWVPITAAYYRPQSQQGAGMDMTSLLNALNPNTTQTELNTKALQELTAQITSGSLAKMYGGELPKQLQGRNLQWNLTPEEYKLAFAPQVAAAAQNYVEAPKPFTPPTGYQGNAGATSPNVPPAPLTPVEQVLKAIQDLNNFLAGGPPKETTVDNTGAELNRELESIKDFFTQLFGGGNKAQSPLGNLTMPTGLSAQNAQPISTKLDLRVDNTTTLMLDGRVVYQAIKPYLAQDLLLAQQTQSAAVRQYII